MQRITWFIKQRVMATLLALVWAVVRTVLAYSTLRNPAAPRSVVAVVQA
jgi:hypothetical protein